MTPTMIAALATLLAEAAASGVEIATILEEARKTGRVPPEQWAAIRQQVDRAEQAWRDA